MRLTKICAWKWLAVLVLMVATGFGVLREIGLPMPEVTLSYTVRGRLQEVAGRVIGWRLTLRYADGRTKAQLLYRGSTNRLRLISGAFYDLDGNCRSRVIDGNGFALIFHENGLPAELVGYLNGIERGPRCRWTAEGEPVREETRDNQRNNHLRTRF